MIFLIKNVKRFNSILNFLLLNLKNKLIRFLTVPDKHGISPFASMNMIDLTFLYQPVQINDNSKYLHQIRNISSILKEN